MFLKPPNTGYCRFFLPINFVLFPQHKRGGENCQCGLSGEQVNITSLAFIFLSLFLHWIGANKKGGFYLFFTEFYSVLWIRIQLGPWIRIRIRIRIRIWIRNLDPDQEEQK